MKGKLEQALVFMLIMAMLASACPLGVAEDAAPVEPRVEEMELALGGEADDLPALEAAPEQAEEPDGGEALSDPIEEGHAALSPMAALAPASLTVANKQTITLNVGEARRLKVTLAGAVSWKSKSAKVASVSADGVVTAVAEGKTSVTTKAGKKSIKVNVVVIDPQKPTSVSLNAGKEIRMTLQETLTLTPLLTPQTARATYTWKSSAPKIVTVTNGLLQPLKEGVSTITVTTQNKKSAKVKVRVEDPYKPTGVALNMTGLITLKPGESVSLIPSLSPSTARASFTWKSSKAKVATVDQNGVVKALSKGTAKITVTTQNKKSAKVTVNVVAEQSASDGLPMRMTSSRYKYFRKYMSKSEIDEVLKVVQPFLEQGLDMPIDNQVYNVWRFVGSFDYGYSMEKKHYNDPYGLTVLGVASCAGITRTVGFCLNLLGIEYQHINENKYKHQWARVNVNGEWWVCDAQGYCLPESDPMASMYIELMN